MQTRMFVKGGAAHDPEHTAQWVFEGWEGERTYCKDCLGPLAGKLLEDTLNRLRCRLVLELVQDGRRSVVCMV